MVLKLTPERWAEPCREGEQAGHEDALYARATNAEPGLHKESKSATDTRFSRHFLPTVNIVPPHLKRGSDGRVDEWAGAQTEFVAKDRPWSSRRWLSASWRGHRAFPWTNWCRVRRTLRARGAKLTPVPAPLGTVDVVRLPPRSALVQWLLLPALLPWRLQGVSHWRRGG